MSITDGLNKQQKDAVTECGKNIFLAAGPGSGKTHTMTRKILYLTEEKKIPPSSILVITFTKDAAVSMQNRFNSLTPLALPVAFGTFHSVFYHMICEFRKPAPVNILFDKNKESIADSTVKYACKKAGEEPESGYTSLFLHAMSIYKNSLDEDNAKASLPDCLKEYFRDMLKYYEGIRRKSHLTDFDDMVYDCRELLLNDKGFKKMWTGRFSYILIDEFQDINPAQYETVMLLASGKTKIFAVGDDDQSIYGFRGSDPTVIRRFLDETGALLMHLDSNFRSDRYIVSSSLKVIDENKERIKKDLISSHEENGEVIIKDFTDKDDQYLHISGLIQCMDDPSKNAVLFRTNIGMQTFATYLTSKGIDFYIREKSSNIFDHFIIRYVTSYLKLAYGNGSEEDLKNVINIPPRYINYEALIGCEGRIENVIKNISHNPAIKNPSEKVARLIALKCDLGFMGSLTPGFAVEYLYRKTGFEKYILSRSNDSKAKQEEYEQILKAAKDFYSGVFSMDEADAIKDKYAEDLERSMKRNKKENAIKLMTVHASKGLEFDTVIIPDCNEGTFPHGKMPDENSVSEERRIFYVAMTRAKFSLHLYYIKGKDNSKYTPSRFLNPLIK